jgi:hypothetical protein
MSRRRGFCAMPVEKPSFQAFSESSIAMYNTTSDVLE